MSRRRFIALLAASALAISIAMYLSVQRNAHRDLHGGVLLPSLASELNTVSALSVRKGGATPSVTVHHQGDRWTVAERADYPADVSKLRKLLLALSDAKIIEEKTSNPASYSVIGVDDPSSPGASGAEITVTARDGKHVVIVGKPVGTGNFVRRGGEGTSYSVEPGITFETEPRRWIDAKLLDIAAATITSVHVAPAAGGAYTVRREVLASAARDTAASAVKQSGNTGAADFILEGTPPGRKAVDAAALAPSSAAFGGLTAEDVAPAGGTDFSKAAVATLTQSDGNAITISGVVTGDRHWVRLQSTKDAALNAKTADRAFEIASYRYDAIFRPLEQLLVPKPPAANKLPATHKTPPTKKPVPAPAS
jgi:Domain of unknown function (DUF4340)